MKRWFLQHKLEHADWSSKPYKFDTQHELVKSGHRVVVESKEVFDVIFAPWPVSTIHLDIAQWETSKEIDHEVRVHVVQSNDTSVSNETLIFIINRDEERGQYLKQKDEIHVKTEAHIIPIWIVNESQRIRMVKRHNSLVE